MVDASGCVITTARGGRGSHDHLRWTADATVCGRATQCRSHFRLRDICLTAILSYAEGEGTQSILRATLDLFYQPQPAAILVKHGKTPGADASTTQPDLTAGAKVPRARNFPYGSTRQFHRISELTGSNASALRSIERPRRFPSPYGSVRVQWKRLGKQATDQRSETPPFYVSCFVARNLYETTPINRP